jgi:hypothetical protein
LEKSFFSISMACSKLKLKRQLNRARSADLIEGIETATRATSPEAVRQRLRRAAEQRVGQVVGGIAEVCVVEDVESEGMIETYPGFNESSEFGR